MTFHSLTPIAAPAMMKSLQVRWGSKGAFYAVQFQKGLPETLLELSKIPTREAPSVYVGV